MKLRIFLNLLIVFLFFISGCYQIITEPEYPWESESYIPGTVRSAGNSVLISFLGEYQFTDHVYLDSIKSWYHEPAEYCSNNPDSCRSIWDGGYYNLIYKYVADANPSVSAKIELQVDTSGNVFGGLQQLPQCSLASVDCKRLLPLDEIFNAAVKGGLKPGITDWEITFDYDGDLQTYIWNIRATYTRSEEYYSASGELYAVDAYRGIILKRLGWSRIA
jgi:hypothetical protein